MTFVSRALAAVLGFGFLIPSVYTQSNFPPETTWEIGQLSVSPFLDGPNRFCNLTNGGFAAYGRGGTTAVFNAEETVLWDSDVPIPAGQACPLDGACSLTFQLDGNLVSSFEGTTVWSTGTEGRGMWLVCSEISPWLWIVNGAGAVIWTTNST